METGLSKVKIFTNNATEETHTIPISANITFSPVMQFNLLGETRNYSNPVMTNITLSSNLTMTVEPFPPFYQPLVDYIKNIIEPSANFILATIIPVATALFGLRVYFKKKHSSPRKKYKRNNIKKTSTDTS